MKHVITYVCTPINELLNYVNKQIKCMSIDQKTILIATDIKREQTVDVPNTSIRVNDKIKKKKIVHIYSIHTHTCIGDDQNFFDKNLLKIYFSF